MLKATYLNVLLITLWCPIPGQSQVINDFSTNSVNHLNLWTGGRDFTIANNSVHLRGPSAWWMESFANTTSCYDLSTKAIKIMYHLEETQSNIVELYQKSETFLHISPYPWTAEIKLDHSRRHAIIPLLSAFPQANLSCIHAWAIRRPLVLHFIELVDVLESYTYHVPTAQVIRLPLDISTSKKNRRKYKVVLVDDFKFKFGLKRSFNNLGCVRVGTFGKFLDQGGLVLRDGHTWHEELTHATSCTDLTNYTFRITYSSTVSALRILRLAYKPIICESFQRKQVGAAIFFFSGNNLVVDVPVSAFIGVHPRRIFELIINGPLTIHRLELIKELPTTVARSVHNPFPLLVDNFTHISDPLTHDIGSLNRLNNSRIFSNDVSLHEDCAMLKLAADSLSEYLAPPNKSFDMTGNSFKVMYSTNSTGRRIVALIQNPLPSKKPFRMVMTKHQKLQPLTIYRDVMFFEGSYQETLISMPMFDRGSNKFDSSKVNGLILHGPLAVHSVEIVSDLPPPVPTSPLSILPYDIERNLFTAGRYILVDNFTSSLGDSVNNMGFSRDMDRSVKRELGKVELRHAGHYVTEYLARKYTCIRPPGIGYLITYSTTKSGFRRLRQFAEFFEPRRIYREMKRYVYLKQGIKQIVLIPFDVFSSVETANFSMMEEISALMIYGPMTIHKIEIATSIGLLSENCSRLIRQFVHVTRSNLFEDSHTQLMAIDPPQLRKPIVVKYAEETGIDNGGLGVDFFTSLSLEISKPLHGLFQASVDGDYLMQIDPNSVSVHNYLNLFRFVGRFIGMAIIHKYLLHINFPLSFYKVLLRKNVGLSDLETIDPILFKNLVWVLQNDVSDSGLTMSAGYLDADNHMVIVDLIPMGDTVPVTEDNKQNYVKVYCEWYLVKRVEEQFNMLRSGLIDVVPLGLLHTMHETEIERTIGGTIDLDIEDWRRHVAYKNCQATDSFVEMFWECVTEWDNAKRAQLLHFVTGSYRVPSEGFAKLRNGLFTIAKNEIRNDQLPVSHSCSNTLDLPPYADKDQMQSKLLVAISETNSYEIG